MKELIKKYLTFIKYIISSGISFALDLTLFTIFSYVLKKIVGNEGIIIGTIFARIISSFINYHINRNSVFKHSDNNSKIDSKSFIKYITLVIIQMFVSSFAVYSIYNLTEINETLIKIPIECVLFLVNYFVQKFLIFNQKKS